VAPLEHRLEHDLPLEPVLGATVPVEVDRLRHVNWIVVTLAAVLSFLALVAVGHALVTSVRRRRGDLAVLKTLGFDQRQVRGAVAWQATTMAVIGLLVGIPCGLFVGDVVWRAIADSLGIQSSAPIPALALGALVPCAIVAVNLLAFLPARAAARIRPAIALRAE
jgi:ABC-type lipoprotein release transport system permease subunit